MEDFSQSRGDDDLFDDEIVPISATPSPQKVTTQLSQISLDPPPVIDKRNSPPLNPSFNAQNSRGRGRGGSSQRARGAGGVSKRGGLSDSKYAPKQPTPVPVTTKATNGEAKLPEKSVENGVEQSATESPAQETADTTTPSTDTPPTGPASSSTTATTQQQRTPAVRGDRTATGGVRKPKLTEEELSAKLAAAKERSQSLAAAHARAQADAANFEQRERVAQEKRQKETVNRKAMEGERERNRIRKMKAVGGREWDSEKKEEDFMGGGRRGGRRPPAPEEQEQDLSMYEWHDDRGRGRGRGGRGRGGGGRTGRGGRGSALGSNQNQPNVNAEADFPALPGATKNSSSTQQKPVPKRLNSDNADAGGASWADQVESSEAAKS